MKTEKKEKTKDAFDFRSVESFEKELAKQGKKAEDVYHPSDAPHIVAQKKIEFLYDVMRNGVIMDHANPNQRKWLPVFNLSSGFVFSSSDYLYSFTCAYCGSRLCLFEEEMSDYGANQFIDLWETLIR